MPGTADDYVHYAVATKCVRYTSYECRFSRCHDQYLPPRGHYYDYIVHILPILRLAGQRPFKLRLIDSDCRLKVSFRPIYMRVIID